MSEISIRRTHQLGLNELRSKVERIAAKLEDKFGVTCSWEGDVAQLRHAEFNGQVRLGESDLCIDAKLGFMLSMARGKVESELQRILDRELGPGS